MKKILLPLVTIVGVLSGLIGLTMIRLSKSMEDWEMAWDEEEEEELPCQDLESENLLSHEMLCKYYQQFFLVHCLLLLQMQSLKSHQELQAKGLGPHEILFLSDQNKLSQISQN